MNKLLLVLALSGLWSGCTAAQWQRFQIVNAQIARYVADAEGAINAGLTLATMIAPNDTTLSQIQAASVDVEHVLSMEADVVAKSNSSLDTPAQIVAAFPGFLQGWSHFQGLIQRAPATAQQTGARVSFQMQGLDIRVPALVRDSHGS